MVQQHRSNDGDDPNDGDDSPVDGDAASTSDVVDTTTDPDAADEPLSKGEIFEVLRNQRRRYILQYLKQDDRPVELGDLAQQIAAWEYDTTLEGVTPEQRKRVYTTLQQTHLPKMDAADILSFDSDRGVIEGTERTGDISVYLEIVPGREFAWRELYLSLGAISCALVAALWLGIYPLTQLSDLSWMTVIAGTFTLTAAAHIYHERNMRLGHGDQPPELSYSADE